MAVRSGILAKRGWGCSPTYAPQWDIRTYVQAIIEEHVREKIRLFGSNLYQLLVALLRLRVRRQRRVKLRLQRILDGLRPRQLTSAIRQSRL